MLGVEQLISRRAPTFAVEFGRDFGVGTLLQQAIDFGDDLRFGLAQLPGPGRQLNSQDFGGATLEAYLGNDQGVLSVQGNVFQYQPSHPLAVPIAGAGILLQSGEVFG